MFEDAVRTRLMAQVATLNKRVQTAADLAELLRQKALPNVPATAFVVPAGLRAGNGGDSGAGAFTQEVDQLIAVVLVLRRPGDVTGAKGLVALGPLVDAVIAALCGWMPDAGALGVLRLLRGQIVRLDAGVIFYQLDLSCPWQIRIFS